MKRMRTAAGVVAIAYLAIQVFQDIVYRSLPVPATPADDLAQSATTLHVVRSTLMLFAMVGLVVIYTTVALQRIRVRPIVASVAIACFGVFGLFEIGLRSVELFWTQLQLPAAYAATHDPGILDQAAAFAAIQGALYFPLMLSTWIGSVALWIMFPDRLIRAIVAINLARITARMLTVYAGIPLLPTAIYEQIYLGLVIVFYAPLAYWLLRVRPE
jgi:hypothetical protein